MDDENAPRQYSVLPRNGRAERFWLSFVDGQLCPVDRPEPKEREHNGPPSKTHLIRMNLRAKFKPGERVIYSPDLGAAKKTYYDWLPEAAAEGVVEKRANGGYYLLPWAG